MTRTDFKAYKKPYRPIVPLAPSLWLIAVAAVFGVTVGTTALPTVTFAAPRLNTTIAIGTGDVQLRVSININ